ncbi:hypothetical protein QWY20_18325 [Alkalimonas sp. MEB108]|uniref:Uncharacterized protein n=1 Tax=Alkalimonas cellulosilytica TaxID=3058395 RepID=A0ABU7JA36_9GAMM|nr:hypothetical protein [Alkalimonas sp. MEB108]MEE2003406.1 hypothetical protein [Alkalimonas sp. MEB108]
MTNNPNHDTKPHPDRAFYRGMMVCMVTSAFALAALAIVRR